jgi:hypothetical protein
MSLRSIAWNKTALHMIIAYKKKEVNYVNGMDTTQILFFPLPFSLFKADSQVNFATIRGR